MARGKNAPVQYVVRKGEGVRLTTTFTPLKNSAGETVQAVSIDLSSAQVPDRRYGADGARVEVGNDLVRIMFAQKDPFGGGHSILLIRVPFLGARQFLRAMEPIERGARAYLERFRIPAPLPVEIGQVPRQTAIVDANILAVAFAGREAVLDFYHASPWVILGLQKGADMYAEPIVRVTLTTATMMSVYDAIAEKKPSLPADEMEEEL